MNNPQVHIGQLIEEQVRKKKINIGNFAEQIHCVRENVYNIFAASSVEINRLMLIGDVLDYDFITEVYLKNKYPKNPPTEININLKLSDIKDKQQYLYILSKLKEVANFLQTT